ncbi:MAG: chorismate synthase [Lachnospiraceae bacterium]|nr:chorismate synthase [Lachnospiraceae bacterium]
MAGSSFGTQFRITTFGESHGRALGAVVDGCPAGLAMNEELIQPYMDRRRPGQSAFTTSRKEGDQIKILSGVFEGKTTGTPIALLLENTDQHSGDYDALKNVFRPGHADFCFEEKYGIRDHRGGGRSSGRETAARVAGGAVACLMLKELGISLTAYTSSIGGIQAPFTDREEIFRNPLYMPDKDAAKAAMELIRERSAEADSVGGTISCFADGLPVGLGEPVFDKLDAELAKAMLSIGAVKGFEIGDGFLAAGEGSRGSKNNDGFLVRGGQIIKASNHSGGVLGGISDGDRLFFRVAVKPTPSIAREQKTVTKEGLETTLSIHGRHDPVVVPRAVVVVECMTALVLADLLLQNTCARMENLKKIYGE